VKRLVLSLAVAGIVGSACQTAPPAGPSHPEVSDAQLIAIARAGPNSKVVRNGDIASVIIPGEPGNRWGGATAYDIDMRTLKIIMIIEE
jgi:hypothetical protein